MALIVQKFGGSSVANADRIRNVARIITDTYKAGNDVVVVLSAQGDTTDDLIEKAAELNPKASKREMDMLLATGEQQSIALAAMCIQGMGFPVISLTGWQVGMRTDSGYGNARIKRVAGTRISEELDKGKIVIVAGFQGINKYDDITTPGPWRLGHLCGGPGCLAERRPVSDLHRCGRRLYRRPPSGALRPQAGRDHL
jgi:aspartate kinase